MSTVNCMTGPWSEWSECSRDGRTCGSRGRGTQTKTRQILQLPSPNGQACPNISLSQPCRVARRCNGTYGGWVAGTGRKHLFILLVTSSRQSFLLPGTEQMLSGEWHQSEEDRASTNFGFSNTNLILTAAVCSEILLLAFTKHLLT